TQAVFNVLTGERYKEVSDELILYALGVWGDEEREGIQPDVRDRILDRPRARELAGQPIDEPSLSEFRNRYGGPNASDDEVLLRFLADENSVAKMRANPAPLEYQLNSPIVNLVQGAVSSGFRFVDVHHGNVRVTVKR
ncbi:MAG: hypothetical protein K6W08_10345, partial [Firmicutes bacterium]|nr:hypothetical protein [Bacillota bacterium]